MSMSEKIESVRNLKLKVKDSFSIRQLIIVAIVLFCTAANIIMDYMAPGFDPSVFRNPAYWMSLAVQQSAVVLIMLCVYSFMIDKEIQSNADIAELQKLLSSAHCKLSEYSLTQKFDDYVYIKNFQRKKRAYRTKMERKIFKAKTDEKRKALESEMNKGLKSLTYIKVRYEKIRITEIFSKATLVYPDDESMSDHMGTTTAKMLRNKVIGIVMFGVLLSSLSFDPLGFGWSMLIKTFIKLFQAAYAVYVGGSEGVRFARGNLLSALQNRAKFVQEFIESNKPTDTVLSEMKTEKEKQEEDEAQEILRQRDEIENGKILEKIVY